MKKFQNRPQAGKVLAALLEKYSKRTDVLVLALPRGGVPVGYEIAQQLQVLLDVIIVRKLGVPGSEELAMGAIATNYTQVLNQEIVREVFVSAADIEDVIQRERQELIRRENLYRQGQPFPRLENKIIILVDDGIATGATIRAAIKAVRKEAPKEIIIAVPVASPESIAELAPLVDAIICPLQPEFFSAVGLWYEDFAQTSDNEVCALLAERRRDAQA